jgi:hypothetical protein
MNPTASVDLSKKLSDIMLFFFFTNIIFFDIIRSTKQEKEYKFCK